MIRNILKYSVAVGVSLLAWGCGSKDSQQAPGSREEAVPAVTVEKVYERDVPQTAQYTATVEAYKTNNISSSTPNRIKSILVDVGSRVKAGQRVAVLDDVNIAQLKVRLDNTERQYSRAKQLYEIGGGTLQNVEQLQTEYEAAKRQYDNMVENTVLVSPISGVVTARNYDPGDMTGAQPIVTVEQVNPVKIILNISENDFSKVKTGMPVEVSLDSHPGEKYTGHISLIHPTIDAATRTFTVEVNLANNSDAILPGMFARVDINFGMSKHVVVPDRAVVKQTGSGNRFVYVYNPSDGTVSYNKVELGQRLDNSYELLSGVPDGAEVVISGQTRLADGVKVQIQTPAKP